MYLALYFPTHTGRSKYTCSTCTWPSYSHLHCLGVSASQTEYRGNAAVTAVSNDQAHSQSHVQLFRPKALPRIFQSVICKHMLLPRYIGLTPLYSKAFAFQLFLAKHKIVVIWYIAPLKGHHEAYIKCKAAELILLLEHLHLFLWWTWLCRLWICSCELFFITNMILIPPEGYKQLNLGGSARQRQPGRENTSLYYYRLYYWLMSKMLQIRKMQVCNLETWLTELFFQEETLNYPSLVYINACWFREKNTFDDKIMYFFSVRQTERD